MWGVDSSNLGCNAYGQLLRTSGYDRMAFIPDLTICGYCTAQYIHHSYFILHYAASSTNLSQSSIDARGTAPKGPQDVFCGVRAQHANEETGKRAQHDVD